MSGSGKNGTDGGPAVGAGGANGNKTTDPQCDHLRDERADLKRQPIETLLTSPTEIITSKWTELAQPTKSWWSELPGKYDAAFKFLVTIATILGVVLLAAALAVGHENLGKAFKHGLSIEVAVLGCVGSILQALKAKHRATEYGKLETDFAEASHSRFVKKAWYVVFWGAVLTLLAEIVDLQVDWSEVYRPFWL